LLTPDGFFNKPSWFHVEPQGLMRNSQGFVYFLSKPFFCSTELKKGFELEGSESVPKEKSFEGFVKLKTCFLDSVHPGEHF
jgi:hypothetical protein